MRRAHPRRPLPAVRALLLALGVASLAGLAAGCSFATRSDAFACETQSDCADGRVCERGWCVTTVSGDGGPSDGSVADGPAPGDGGGGAADANPDCPPACTSCSGTTCTITCDSNDACPATIVCPAGWLCEVSCGGRNSCAGGVDCGTGACDVTCSGRNSCAGGVDCSQACACDTACTGMNACSTEPVCPGATPACDIGLDCTSEPGPCNQC